MRIVCRLKPYIQPFERTLALKELRQLAGNRPLPLDKSARTAIEFAVSSRVSATVLAQKLAYWESVGQVTPQITRQTLAEATVSVAKRSSLFEIATSLPLSDKAAPLPKRRCLRYGVHGIHEYRGKFFPQLVRALLNSVDLKAGSSVADTMCGSGTTVVEAMSLGYKAIGLDLNPLSAHITRVKCSLLGADPYRLMAAYENVRDSLSRSHIASTVRWFSKLPSEDQQYLRRWFAADILEQLDRIMTAIASVDLDAARDLCSVSLSNILRRVSWQKEDDLRVRREVIADLNVDAIKEFLDELQSATHHVVSYQLQNQRMRLGRYIVVEGDARTPLSLLKEWHGRIDAVVTSPPYATALPYLDTDRLSLSYLNLLSRPEHRQRDLSMIGNREITEGKRREYWSAYAVAKHNLPGSIVRLIRKIDSLNQTTEVGFRRRNVPMLLAKYFVDMTQVLQGLHALLKPYHFAFLIVGDNHTIAGGEKVSIKTAHLLSDLADSCNFSIRETIPMEMLVSRDIFRKNTGSAESIICLQRR